MLPKRVTLNLLPRNVPTIGVPAQAAATFARLSKMPMAKAPDGRRHASMAASALFEAFHLPPNMTLIGYAEFMALSPTQRAGFNPVQIEVVSSEDATANKGGQTKAPRTAAEGSPLGPNHQGRSANRPVLYARFD